MLRDTVGDATEAVSELDALISGMSNLRGNQDTQFRDFLARHCEVNNVNDATMEKVLETYNLVSILQKRDGVAKTRKEL